MTNTTFYIVWAVLYVLCAVLGLFPIPAAVGILACLGFFVPPAILLWKREPRSAKIIRNLALIWLIGTLVLLIMNILSVALSAAAGTVLYYLMAVLSSPMVCGQYWAIALFGWACLLMTSLKALKK